MNATLDQVSDEICLHFLVCRKSIALYPPEHPRVLESVEQIREGIIRYSRNRGRPFTLETNESPEAEDGHTAARGRLELVRFLKLNLIEKLTIFPHVTTAELVELCAELQIDAARGKSDGPDDDDTLLERAASWKGIRLTFYEPMDLAEDDLGAARLLRRRDGIHTIGRLEPVLARLPPDARTAVRDGLMTPQFLMRVANLQRELKKAALRAEPASTRKLDLVGEIIHSVLPETTEDCVEAEELLARIGKFVAFLEQNVDALAGTVRSFSAADDSELLRRQIREAFSNETTLFAGVGAVQEQKERLSFLFRTGNRAEEESSVASAAETLPERPEDDQKAARGPAEEASCESDVLARMREIHCDIEAIRGRSDALDPQRCFLAVVLELLRGETARRRHVLERGAAVLDTLAPAIEDAEFAAWTAREMVAVEGAGSDAAVQLLVDLLQSLDKAAVVEIFSGVLVPEGGTAVAKECLEHLVKRARGKAVPLLTALLGAGNESLAQVARSILISLAGRPQVLAQWAGDDPGSLLDPPVFDRVIGDLPPERVTEAFKLYFSRTPPHAAAQFIGKLPPQAQVCERILFTAMDYGGRKTRLAAIENLWKCPSDVSVATLQGLVRRNNARDLLDLDEVTATLGALVRIEKPGLSSFLEEILRRRSMFFHVWRKEIRRTLSQLLEKTRKEGR